MASANGESDENSSLSRIIRASRTWLCGCLLLAVEQWGQYPRGGLVEFSEDVAETPAAPSTRGWGTPGPCPQPDLVGCPPRLLVGGAAITAGMNPFGVVPSSTCGWGSLHAVMAGVSPGALSTCEWGSNSGCGCLPWCWCPVHLWVRQLQLGGEKVSCGDESAWVKDRPHHEISCG